MYNITGTQLTSKCCNLTAVSLLMLSVPILIVILLFGCSRLFWNTMYVVLLISKDNLSAPNQSPNMFRYILMFVYSCVRFELVW